MAALTFVPDPPAQLKFVPDAKPPSAARQWAGAVVRPISRAVSDTLGIVDKPIATATNAISEALGSKYREEPYSSKLENWTNRTFPAPTSTVGRVAEGASEFVAGGAIGDAAAGAARAAGVLPDIFAKVAPEARSLIDKGVLTTPGIRRGGWVGKLEQHLAKLPLSGHMAAKARTEAVRDWSTGELNDIVTSAGGKKIPAGLTGRAALRNVSGQLKDLRQGVLDVMHGDLHSGGEDSFAGAIDRVKADATLKRMPAELRTKLDDFVKDEITDKFKGGKADGLTIQKIDERLRVEAQTFARSNNPYERQYGDALKKIQADMHTMLARQNPKAEAALQRVNNSYAGFKSAAKASLAAGKSGEFTPSQLVGAIKARDISKDKMASSLGTAHGLEKAEGAQTTLGTTVPDSGTPGTLELMHAAGRAGAEGVGSLGTGGVLPAATNLAYTKPVLRFLQKRALAPATHRVGRKLAYTAVAGGKARRAAEDDED